jgi:hypothetical protein
MSCSRLLKGPSPSCPDSELVALTCVAFWPCLLTLLGVLTVDCNALEVVAKVVAVLLLAQPIAVALRVHVLGGSGGRCREERWRTERLRVRAG